MMQLWSGLRVWWREPVREQGVASAISLLVRNLWSFVCESMPERRRQRYGDMEYDWEHRVDTTSGTAGWRRAAAGIVSFPLSADRPGFVSGDNGEPPHRVRNSSPSSISVPA